MAETSIEWADFTFNPWIGCTEVSGACDHCYARTWGNRFGVEWGVGKPRCRTSEANWKQPLAWNRAAEKSGIRLRVFCASLADVFDTEVDPVWRHDLFNLIEATPKLDWLLLTKRHAVARRMLPDRPWPQIRIGMTVENGLTAAMRLSRLAQLGAFGWKTFISYEPALGPVDWWGWLNPEGIAGGTLHWLIAGGESGAGARPAHPDWFRSARDACERAGVPFLFKQWGEWIPQHGAISALPIEIGDDPEISRFDHLDWEGDRWGAPYRPMWCDDVPADTVARIGKKAGGRLLDGRTWDQFPEVNL